MNLTERRANLVNEINNINDEQTLEMLQETLGYYTHNNSKDVTDGLTPHEMQELTSGFQEPAEKDTISEEEFSKLFSRWSTK